LHLFIEDTLVDKGDRKLALHREAGFLTCGTPLWVGARREGTRSSPAAPQSHLPLDTGRRMLWGRLVCITVGKPEKRNI